MKKMYKPTGQRQYRALEDTSDNVLPSRPEDGSRSRVGLAPQIDKLPQRNTDGAPSPWPTASQKPT